MPYIFTEEVWNAKDADESVELKSEFERCKIVVVEYTTTGATGTLNIKGKVHELGAFSNVPYIRQDVADLQTPATTQLTLTGTGVYRYVILGWWRRLQLVMTISAGTISCGVAGSSHGELFPRVIKT